MLVNVFQHLGGQDATQLPVGCERRRSSDHNVELASKLVVFVGFIGSAHFDVDDGGAARALRVTLDDKVGRQLSEEGVKRRHALYLILTYEAYVLAFKGIHEHEVKVIMLHAVIVRIITHLVERVCHECKRLPNVRHRISVL